MTAPRSSARRALSATVLVLLLVAGCSTKDNGGAFTAGPPSSGPPPPLNPTAAALVPASIRTAGRFRAGVDPSHPPLAFLQGGSVQGFDDDVLQAVGAQLGLKVEVIERTAPALPTALLAGEVDAVAPGPQPVTAAPGGTSVEVPLVQVGAVILVRGATSPCGRPVAVVADAPAPCAGSSQPVATAHDGLDALRRGAVAGVAVDSATGAYLLQTDRTLQAAGPATSLQTVGLLVTASLRDAVTAALRAVKAAGIYAQILKTWGLQAYAVVPD